MSRARAKSRVPEPTAPAIITAEHRQDRPVSVVAGAPKAWRRCSVLELAFERGQLAENGARHAAKNRFDAGQDYAKLFLVAQSSGKDSTDLDRVMSVSSRMPLSQRQAEAIRSLISIESHMGMRDRRIVRMVCGENHKLSDAVLSCCGTGYRDRVTARFREALDVLIEAMETARRAPGSFNVSRQTDET